MSTPHGDYEVQRAFALVGKTMASVEVETRADRTMALTLFFEDGSSVTVGYFASYAEDSSLEFSINDGRGNMSEPRFSP
jgi:hypothetical protein